MTSLQLARCVRELTEASVAGWRCHLAQLCTGRGSLTEAGAACWHCPTSKTRALRAGCRAAQPRAAQPVLRGGGGQRICSA